MRTTLDGKPSSRARAGATITTMNEELDALAERIRELTQMIHGLRTENQDLRSRLALQDAELAAMRQRVETAGVRLDQLMAKIAGPAPTSHS